MPCYNNGKYVAQAIESVQAQTHKDWQLVVVNDGSIDESERVIMQYAATDKRIKYIRQENAGVSAARNRGVQEAVEEYICFLDADDRLKKNHLSLLINAVKSGEKIVYGGITQRTIHHGIMNDYPKPISTSNIVDAILNNDNISAPYNVLIKTELLKEVRFNERYTYGEDAVLKLQLFNLVDNIALIPLTGYIYVRDSENNSAVDRYHERMEDAVNEKFLLLASILQKYGCAKEEAEKLSHKMYYDAAIVPILTNPFHIGTPLSFWGKYKRILNNFFSDESLPARIFKECSSKNDNNPFCRLLRLGRNLHSCLFVTAVLELFYRFKYKKLQKCC